MLRNRRLPAWWEVALRLVAPLAALAVEGWAALVAAVVIQEGGLWIARRVAPESAYAGWLFLGAYLLRVVLIVPLHVWRKLVNGNGAAFQDDYTNDLVGEWLLRIAHGDGLAIFPGHQHLLDGIYSYVLMGVYAIIGYAPIVPRLLNAGLAALVAVLILQIAARAFRPSVGLLAGVLAAVLPTLVVWSIVTLKETLLLLVVVAGLRVLQVMTEAPIRSGTFATALVVLVGVLALLEDLRAGNAALLLALAAAIVLSRSPRKPPVWVTVSLACVVTLVASVTFVLWRGDVTDRPPAGVLEDIVLVVRHRRAQEAASARSQIRLQADVVTPQGGELPEAEAISDATPFGVMTDIVDPLGYALLAPAPWQVRSLRDLAAAGEMLIWYVLLLAAPFAWRGAPRQPLFLVCLTVFGVVNWLALAMSEGNLGNLLRHRSMLTPTLIVLSAAGLSWLWWRLVQPLGVPSVPALWREVPGASR